jgi:hypothetical protein
MIKACGHKKPQAFTRMNHSFFFILFSFGLFLSSNADAQTAADSSTRQSHTLISYVFTGYPIEIGAELDYRPSQVFAVSAGIGNVGQMLYIGPQIRIVKAKGIFKDIGLGLRYLYYDNTNTSYNGLMFTIGTMPSSLRWYSIQFGSILLSPTDSRSFKLSWFVPVVQLSLRLF